MRIENESRGERVTIQVNGSPVSAYQGESVHAALMASGHLNLRKSRIQGEPRGIFCGMGVCYECLVTIDGKPNQRACMRTVEENMEIITHDNDV